MSLVRSRAWRRLGDGAGERGQAGRGVPNRCTRESSKSDLGGTRSCMYHCWCYCLQICDWRQLRNYCGRPKASSIIAALDSIGSSSAMTEATRGSSGSEGEESGLTLLGFWTSPFVLRTRFALNLKGVPYRYVEEDLFGDGTKSRLLLASNPAHGGKVPVLVHDGRPVAESMVILEYIDEAFPEHHPRLLPSGGGPHERATARFWAAYVDQKLLPTWVPLYAGKTVEERVKAAGEVVAVLQTFEGVLGEKEFFGGESVGLVDVTLGGFIGWLRASEAMCGVRTIDPARTPLVTAWAERFAALDGVREIVPDVPRLVEYNLMKRARLGLPFLPPHQQPQ